MPHKRGECWAQWQLHVSIFENDLIRSHCDWNSHTFFLCWGPTRDGSDRDLRARPSATSKVAEAGAVHVLSPCKRRVRYVAANGSVKHVDFHHCPS